MTAETAAAAADQTLEREEEPRAAAAPRHAFFSFIGLRPVRGGAIALQTNELALRATNERRASISRGRGGCAPLVGVTLASRALAVKPAAAGNRCWKPTLAREASEPR